MKGECNIIGDMLPLYVENIASAETRAFVDQHLAGCSGCQQRLKAMTAATPKTPAAGRAMPLKHLKKKLLQQKIAAVAFTAALVLSLALMGFAYLTTPNFLPYTPDTVSVAESPGGTLVISFGEGVTGYTIERHPEAAENAVAYYVSAWNTLLDLHVTGQRAQNATLNIDMGTNNAVYYSLNDTEIKGDVLLYGAALYDGVVTLPRLVLGYYLTIAGVLFGVVLVLLLVFRKRETLRQRLGRALLVPFSYMAGHVCVKGFTTKSYAAGRDFVLIALAAILIFLACLLGLHLYRAAKEKNRTEGQFQ